MGPFFSPDEHAVNEAFVPANFLAIRKLVEESAPEIKQHLGFGPLLEAAVDGTLGAISFRQFAPRSTGPENPEDAFKTLAVVERRAASLSRALALW